METSLRVDNFFDLKSSGPVVVFKFLNLNTVLSHGMVLKRGEGSRWKIIGISSSTIKHSEVPCGKDQIMMGYRLEHISGDKVLKKGDLVYIESEKLE